MTLDRTWYNNLVDDTGSGTVGTIWNKSQINAFINSIDAELPAQIVDVPYNAADYTASGGTTPTWTVPAGSLTYFCYHVVGHLVTVNFGTGVTTIAGSPTMLLIHIPAAIVPAAPANRNAVGYALGNGFAASVQIYAGDPYIRASHIDGSAWANGASTLNFMFAYLL